MSDAKDLVFGPCQTCLRPICQCPAKHTPPPDAQAMTREQVEERIKWYGENFVLYRTRWANELLAHDAAQRETIRRLEGQRDELNKLCTAHERIEADLMGQFDQLQARLTASEATIVRVYKLEKEIRDATHEMNYLSSMGMEFIEQSVKWYQSRLSPSPVPRWTTARPTVAGWYWWRKGSGYSNDMVAIFYEEPHSEWKARFLGLKGGEIGTLPVNVCDGEWQGPLTPGEE